MRQGRRCDLRRTACLAAYNSAAPEVCHGRGTVPEAAAMTHQLHRPYRKPNRRELSSHSAERYSCRLCVHLH
eukprot:1448969-Pyramimonas_sp.AAC.1